MSYRASKVIRGYLLTRPAEWHGYAKLGPGIGRLLQVPFGLTDRGTGIVWYFYAAPLAAAPAPFNGKDRLGISTVRPSGGNTKSMVYPALEEPFLGDSGVRIFIRDGRLGYDNGPSDGEFYAGGRVISKGLTGPFSTRYELKPGAGFAFGNPLSFETVVADW